eukprot:scaffold22098_cov76-Cyclotella_meneghiniana.AAC.6
MSSARRAAPALGQRPPACPWTGRRGVGFYVDGGVAGGRRATDWVLWSMCFVSGQWASSLTLFYPAHFNPVYQNFTWSTPPHHVTRRTQHLIGM